MIDIIHMAVAIRQTDHIIHCSQNILGVMVVAFSSGCSLEKRQFLPIAVVIITLLMPAATVCSACLRVIRWPGSTRSSPVRWSTMFSAEIAPTKRSVKRSFLLIL